MYQIEGTAITTSVRIITSFDAPAPAHRRARRAAQIILQRGTHTRISHTRTFVTVTGWTGPNRLTTALYYPARAR